jgi:hypothetical protein
LYDGGLYERLPLFEPYERFPLYELDGRFAVVREDAPADPLPDQGGRFAALLVRGAFIVLLG